MFLLPVNKKIRFVIILMFSAMLIMAAGCRTETVEEDNNDKEKIIFAGLNWDSALINNEIARFIIENGYGYETDFIPGETIPLFIGLGNGDVDVNMECWVENQQEAYDQGIESGDIIDLGTNFNDNVQGMFVPTYMIKGDPDRGIEPMTPDLKTIEDLPQYWEIFRDPEVPSKGRFYGGVPGWEADKIITEKFETYGLSETYNIFRPGTAAALDASLISAYERGEPWFGYNWGPTWIFGMLDLTQIEEPPYSDELWNDGYGCSFPAVNVNILVNKNLPDRAPEIVEFLTRYETNNIVLSEVLAFMQENDADYEQAGLWFLKNYEELWTQWVSDEVAEKVKSALK